MWVMILHTCGFVFVYILQILNQHDNTQKSYYNQIDVQFRHCDR